MSIEESTDYHFITYYLVGKSVIENMQANNIDIPSDINLSDNFFLFFGWYIITYL